MRFHFDGGPLDGIATPDIPWWPAPLPQRPPDEIVTKQPTSAVYELAYAIGDHVEYRYSDSRTRCVREERRRERSALMRPLGVLAIAIFGMVLTSALGWVIVATMLRVIAAVAGAISLLRIRTRFRHVMSPRAVLMGKVLFALHILLATWAAVTLMVQVVY